MPSMWKLLVTVGAVPSSAFGSDERDAANPCNTIWLYGSKAKAITHKVLSHKMVRSNRRSLGLGVAHVSSALQAGLRKYAK